MKNRQKNIILIILGLFILSFSFPSNTLKLLFESKDSLSVSFSIEETKGSKKIFEDKEISIKCSIPLNKIQQSATKNKSDFLKCSQRYFEIIYPPPEFVS